MVTHQFKDYSSLFLTSDLDVHEDSRSPCITSESNQVYPRDPSELTGVRFSHGDGYRGARNPVRRDSKIAHYGWEKVRMGEIARQKMPSLRSPEKII